MTAPDQGPSILFFSGGTALKRLSRVLTAYTYNSIHLITPFDSGGSSKEIRKWFNILAVGDIRNRLLSLADTGQKRVAVITKLLSYRLSEHAPESALRKELNSILSDEHPLIKKISYPEKGMIIHFLKKFISRMPDQFSLKKASIGNLVLTGIYLETQRDIDTTILTFSGLIRARGVVRPVVNQNLHMGAVLEDGSVILGQHNITGKEKKPLNKKIKEVFITRSLNFCEKTIPEIDELARKLITSADLICYPMGSFFSSLIINLIPDGICEAIAKNPNPKVFIPNTFHDPELFGYSLTEQIKFLVDTLKKNRDVKVEEVLNFIILDDKTPYYKKHIDLLFLKKFNIKPVISSLTLPSLEIHPKKLCDLLFSLSSHLIRA